MAKRMPALLGGHATGTPRKNGGRTNAGNTAQDPLPGSGPEWSDRASPAGLSFFCCRSISGPPENHRPSPQHAGWSHHGGFRGAFTGPSGVYRESEHKMLWQLTISPSLDTRVLSAVCQRGAGKPAQRVQTMERPENPPIPEWPEMGGDRAGNWETGIFFPGTPSHSRHGVPVPREVRPLGRRAPARKGQPGPKHLHAAGQASGERRSAREASLTPVSRTAASGIVTKTGIPGL